MSASNQLKKIASRVLLEDNPLPEDPSFSQRLWHKFLCPPHSTAAYLLTRGIICLLSWLTAYALTKEDALPGGNIFTLMVLVFFAFIGGFLVSLINLPPLLGMLIVGFMLRNVPVINIARDIDPKWSSVLRNIALTVILTRAGLGLDGRALRKLSKSVILLAFLPCLMETVAVGFASFLIMSFPWLWAFLLGFLQSAVSPAVVVPSMIKLQESKLGSDKGIPTLLIAASSLDDVLAISGFSVLQGIIFSTADASIWFQILQGPLEIVIGVVYGIGVGIIFWYLPHREHAHVSVLRFMFLFLGGLLSILMLKQAGFSGAGALGCLIAAFVAGHKWRTPGWDIERVKVTTVFAHLWVFFQPILFGLIGTEVALEKIHSEFIGLAVAVLACGLFFRMVMTMLATTGSGLNWKEKFFTAIAWIPKATVQAALGSVALDYARKVNADEATIVLGEKIVTIAVLLIIITAPLGAVGVGLCAPLLLKKDQEVTEQNGVEVPVADYSSVAPDPNIREETIKMIEE